MDNNWSIEAIQETAASNWSLEGDNQLLNLMKSISKNLEQRCITSNNNLNRLMLDVDKTKIKLGNATTKFLDLNNAKFVEHTVMDMDSSLANTEKCSTGQSDKTFVPIPKAMEEAVTNGLNMMDRCYEKVLLNFEDSDDEDENAQKHVVCRPKDPYLNRPLPHLIGSKQWNEKWHVGLIESEEEVLSDEEPEEFSQSSSEEEDSISNSPQTSNPPTTSESESAPPVSTVIHREDLFHRLSDDVEEKSPLFTPEDKKHREKVKVLPTTIVPSTQNVAKNSESINKSKQLTEPSVPSTEQPPQSIFVQPKRPEQKYLNLFDDEPPLLDEPIRNERKPVNLFLDSDDEDDPIIDTKRPASIFNNNVATNRPTVPPSSIPTIDNVPPPTKIAFPIDVDDKNDATVQRSEIKPTLKSNDFGGLFDDEPPDDFFDIIVREQKSSLAKVDNKQLEKPKQRSKTVNLFESDDDDDDDDFSKIIGATKKSDSKVPAVSVVAKEKIPTAKQMGNPVVSHSPYSSPFKPFQNPGPPKSYVSFLDDVSPGFDDEKEPTTTTTRKPIESHPTTSTAKSLLDDTPPEDIIVSPTTSNRKSTAKIIYDDIAATMQEKSTPPTPLSNSLFDETPPDDDIVVAPPVALPRKSTPKVIEDSSQSTAIPAANKEPNSDDSLTRDETDQSMAFKKNLSIFSNPEAGKLPTVDKETKPKPNKLKTNFNINVAALLPGAKLPSQKQSTTVKQDRIEEPESEPEKVNNNISSDTVTKTTSTEDSSGRLTSLSKNRAKIQVQRKPSTRTGRQNLYKKTLADDVETTDSVSSEVNKGEEKEVTNTTPLESERKTDVEDNDWLSQTTTLEQPSPPPLESINANSIVDDEEDWLKTIDEKPSSPSKTDWLSTKEEVIAEPKPSTQTMSHVINYDWLTASNLPPEDINPPSNYSLHDDHDDQDDWLTSYVSKEKSSSVVTDLPDEDDWLVTSGTKEQSSKAVPTVVAALEKEEEEDWLLRATVRSEKNNNVEADEDDWFTKSLAPPKASTSGAEINPHPVESDGNRSDSRKSIVETSKTQSKLFDSDDENEVTDVQGQSRPKLDLDGKISDIFQAKTETKSFLNSTLFDDDEVPPPTINSGKTSPPNVAKQSPTKMDVKSESFQSKQETKKSVSSKLFDDDDDDDDDLFTSISQQKVATKQSATKTAVKTTNNVSIKVTSKSLFSDDDNSDPDDLFGATAKKPKGKVGIGSKSKVEPKIIKTGLFDDEDEDDEDIFASKTQKQRVTQTDTKKKPSSITKSVATIPASNDPLADLLK